MSSPCQRILITGKNISEFFKKSVHFLIFRSKNGTVYISKERNAASPPPARPVFPARPIDKSRPEDYNNDMDRINIPADIRGILHTLNRTHQAYLVGGCVRDCLLGRAPHDWDVTTSASPEEVMALFPGSRPLRFGTVLLPGGVEVTTFRGEEGYGDGRHPDRVAFVGTLDEDVSRRDSTVNALCADESGKVIDPAGGLADLAAGVIRTVGDPDTRFAEDALRMLRAVRFAARYGWTIHPDAREAIRRQAPLCALLSGERVRAEMRELLLSPHPEYVSEYISLGLWTALFPRKGEIDPDPFVLLSALPADFPVRLGGLLALAGGEIAWADRLRLSRAEQTRVGDFLTAFAASPAFGRAAWAELLTRAGENEIRLSLKLKILLYSTYHDPRYAQAEAQAADFERALSQGGLVREGLAVTGGDLYAIGLRGAAISRALTALHAHVLAHPEDQTKERLLALAREWAADKAARKADEQEET